MQEPRWWAQASRGSGVTDAAGTSPCWLLAWLPNSRCPAPGPAHRLPGLELGAVDEGAVGAAQVGDL